MPQRTQSGAGWRLGAVLAMCMALAPVAQGASLDTMAEQLSELRREVETLSTDLGLKKEALRGKLRALDQQKAELQVQLRQQELRRSQLDQALETEKALRAEIIAEGQALTPAVSESIATIRGSVEGSLPFRLDERLAELDAIQAGLDGKTLTPREAAQRLWAFSEDELRLSKENALDRMVITLDGEEVLCDVARLGMVALYFKTDDGVVGRAVRSGEGWTYAPYSDSVSQQQVLELFDALEKQIRVGFFQLPAAIDPGAVEVK